MSNKIRIKMGPIEFEAEGDSELIERERAQFFSLLPQAIMAVTPVVSKPAQLIEAATVIEATSKDKGPEVLFTGAERPIVQDYESIASFLNEKNFSCDFELVLGVAYFIEIIERSGSVTSKDIENKLDEARFAKPSNTSQFLSMNIKKGLLKECTEKKGLLKTYRLLDKGIKWCESYVAKEAEQQKKKTTKSKTAKPPKDSTLLSISLDELHLENYCDVTKLDKFIEQLLVVMLMYTIEKNIEYFSFSDIVSIFKVKFKLPATDRKVRYAFDNGGTMFDKKVEKKVAYHKLLSGGIKEAERINSEQKTTMQAN